jgi:hypothetical protein
MPGATSRNATIGSASCLPNWPWRCSHCGLSVATMNISASRTVTAWAKNSQKRLSI